MIVNNTEITALCGDITKADYVDAIVNSTNTKLVDHNGVNGAIQKAAGNDLWKACEKIGECKIGEAVITGAFNLPCKYIIHAVGPIWDSHNHLAGMQLGSCYRNVLEIAESLHIRTIGFSSISTGAHGYPLTEAAEIAVKEAVDYVKSHPNAFDKLIWICRYDNTKHAYEEAIRIKEEFQTVNTLVDTLSIPLKTADLNNTVVYGPAISCPLHGHNLEKVKLILGYIDSNGKQSLTVISAGFCDTCKAFFVREQTMKAVQEDGIPLCRAVPWKEYKKGLKSANADMHSSPDSVLSQFGYSISEEGSPTDIQRKAILALLIYKAVIMRGSIITYLNQKDSYYKKIHPSDKSDSIWKKDELFVREFIIAQMM